MNDWITDGSIPPLNELGHSAPVLICAQEFGQDRVFILARCFVPLGQPPVWEYWQEFYGMDRPWYVAEPVWGWWAIPEPPSQDTIDKLRHEQLKGA